MTQKKLRHKERHKRIPKNKVDLLAYDKLIHKVIWNISKARGMWVKRITDDLIQQGYIGLIEAQKSYDPTKGTFVTWAYLKIHKHMLRLIDKENKNRYRQVHLEELSKQSSGVSAAQDYSSWQEIFPSRQVDYGSILRLALVDSIDIQMVELFMSGTYYRNLHFKLGLTEEEVVERWAGAKQLVIEVCRELYKSDLV